MKTKLKSFLPNWLLWAAALGLPYLGETATSQTFSDANWMSMGGIQGANGLVQTVAVDGAGNLYVGGRFNVIGDLVANYIAKWDGTRWSALGSGMNEFGLVAALAVSGSNLYAGGSRSPCAASTDHRSRLSKGKKRQAAAFSVTVPVRFGACISPMAPACPGSH